MCENSHHRKTSTLTPTPTRRPRSHHSYTLICEEPLTDVIGMSEQERYDLMDAEYDALRRSQEGRAVWIVSQHEGERLWDATLTAFIQGNWVAVVLCAQATCERTPAALIYNLFSIPEPPKNWDRWGLGALVKYCRDERLVEDGLLNEVAVL